MKDDELLKAVAEAARAEDRASDPRWSARVRGTLGERELQALEELARRDPEGRDAWEASRPLDGEARSRIVDRILAGMQAPEAPVLAPAAPGRKPTPEAAATPPPSPTAPGAQVAGAGEVRPLPVKRGAPAATKRRTPAVLVATSALAAAAALLLLFRLAPPRSQDQGSGPVAPPGAQSFPPVPAYAVAVSGGDQTMRGAPGAAPEDGQATSVGPGSTLEITLRPATRVEGPLEVRAFLVRDGEARPWDVKIELSSQGAARIAGDRETLFQGVPAGRYGIALAIGRPGSLPAGPEDVLRALKLGETTGFRLLRREIRLYE
ncbi:hypothetical protein WMF37_01635 [Sorangium sp. So ce291]|uniref:hypothetical protein n=1 Tax=Sorangium sp. So ce291 TaxID=3133294 RepID=UPI003F5D8282